MALPPFLPPPHGPKGRWGGGRKEIPGDQNQKSNLEEALQRMANAGCKLRQAFAADSHRGEPPDLRTSSWTHRIEPAWWICDSIQMERVEGFPER